MKSVEEAMEDRRENNAGGDEGDEAGIERVEGGEDLSRNRLHRIDRPHAAEDHRGVQQCVDPGKMFQKMIAENADGERTGDKAHRRARVAAQPAEKLRARQEVLGAALVHGTSVVLFLGFNQSKKTLGKLLLDSSAF